MVQLLQVLSSFLCLISLLFASSLLVFLISADEQLWRKTARLKTDIAFIHSCFNYTHLNFFLVSNKREASKPNGHWISEVSVEKSSSTEWTIVMTPAKCGDNIPLIDIAGAQRTDVEEERNFHFNEFHSAIKVKRKQAASPPITGTFDLLHQNRTIRGIVTVLVQ